LGPADLHEVMKNVHISYNDKVLVGFDKSDDAGVYKLTDEIALVQTLDFFTPIVDDFYTFGKIAATNSLSDVYAMGGNPITAMNIVAFPVTKFSLDKLSEILNGGLEVLNSAGVQLLGGHSIDDPELKYGMSITGTINPSKILLNNGIKDGDAIILTKPLGTGIIGTVVKAGMAEKKIIEPFINSMTQLNKDAAEIMTKYKINSCTDVTGFGLTGHLKEMISNDKIKIKIDSSKLPILPGVKENSEMGLVPAGLYNNKDFVGKFCKVDNSIPMHLVDLLFDPQTSGGLLISLPFEEAKKLVKKYNDFGMESAVIIAEVVDSDIASIEVY